MLGAELMVAAGRERVDAVLDLLLETMDPDVVGAACVSLDGIVLTARFAAEVNVDRTGAVAATMLGVTRRVGIELRIGAAEEVILRGSNGLFMVMPTGDTHLLAVCMGQEANMGMVRFRAREAAEAITRAIAGGDRE